MKTYLIVQYATSDIMVYDFTTSTAEFVLCQNGTIHSYFPLQAENADLALKMGEIFFKKMPNENLKTFNISKNVSKHAKPCQKVTRLYRKDLERYLREAKGNITRAAKLAGTGKRIFYRKLSPLERRTIKSEFE